MHILVTGNMGYIGPELLVHFQKTRPDAALVGVDSAWFAHCLTDAKVLPERLLVKQWFGDLRTLDLDKLCQGIDAVVHLAAVSNDPIGNRFGGVTEDINRGCTTRLAQAAKRAGVKRFVFASSCSMYGAGGDEARTEESPLTPLTAYAKAKVGAEGDLHALADENFVVTSLRFATACGMSRRLRLDLVLNDFCASAVATGEIVILSDGAPWRPLIHVDDMCRAIDWAAERKADNGGAFCAVNTGSDVWNYQMKDLAFAARDVIGGVNVAIATDAQPDKRSYRVSFAKFAKLAPEHQPLVSIEKAVEGLTVGLKNMAFADPNFRKTEFMRLKVLTNHIDEGRIGEDLFWK